MGIVRLLVTTGRCPGYGIDHIARQGGRRGRAVADGAESEGRSMGGKYVARPPVASRQPDPKPGRQDRGTFSA
jgi:hypothetical protein